MFSKGSSNSISFAMVTTVVGDHGRSEFLFKKNISSFGPSFIFTVFASLSTPPAAFSGFFRHIYLFAISLSSFPK
jgi:hypothetical protein